MSGVVVARAPIAPPGVGVQGPSHLFELRTYTANPGKFEAMKARFREHIIPLFGKHGLTLIGFWTYADSPASANTLVYILAHENRAAAERNWAASLADPVRQRVWQETEAEDPIKGTWSRSSEPDRSLADQVDRRDGTLMGPG
jgi:hypothetical protein